MKDQIIWKSSPLIWSTLWQCLSWRSIFWNFWSTKSGRKQSGRKPVTCASVNLISPYQISIHVWARILVLIHFFLNEAQFVYFDTFWHFTFSNNVNKYIHPHTLSFTVFRNWPSAAVHTHHSRHDNSHTQSLGKIGNTLLPATW